MAIHDLFSKRQRGLRSQPSDVLFYDQLPNALRTQILYIIGDTIGDGVYPRTDSFYYNIVHEILLREYGVVQLYSDSYRIEPKTDLTNFIAHHEDVEEVLDAVELLFRVINEVLIRDIGYEPRRVAVVKESIDDLNNRFKEHAIGYSYESGKIMRIDSTYIHTEIVKPVLSLINSPMFAGVDEEYRKAHEHYRHGRNKECLNECLKAFESVMKVICTQKSWPFSPAATSSALITTIINNNLIPTYIQTQLTSLRSALESGVPTIRNRIGGHGQGAVAITADDMTTRYALNLTGSNIIYLIELSGL